MTAGTRKHVLLLCPPASYRLNAYLNAATALDIDITVVSHGEHSLVTELANGLHIDIENPQQAVKRITEFAAANEVSGVLATDDATVEIAARSASALGLPGNSPEAARLSRRKDLARSHLARHELPVPPHRTIDFSKPLQTQLEGFPLPAVIKPVALSASRGVIRADTPDTLVSACGQVGQIISESSDEFENSHALLEAYIDGREVAADGIVIHGKLQPLALYDKPDPLTGPYFEETYYVTPSRLPPSLQQTIWQIIEKACHALGIRQGPVHAELRIGEDGPVILEIAARTIGGNCARMFDDSLNTSLESLALSAVLGLPVTLQARENAHGVLMIPIPRAGVLRKVEGVTHAREVEFVTDIQITALPGHELKTLPQASSYLGFIFSRAPTAALAEQALRQAHTRLRVKIDPFWDLGTPDN